MIQNFVSIYSPLQEIYLPLFATEKGRKVYEETLDAVKKQFPQYVREIQGTADGANVPFSKVQFCNIISLSLSIYLIIIAKKLEYIRFRS